MLIQQVPIYGAAAKGLAAPYTLNFSTDLEHLIPLRGSWQGDPVKARTLYVNNYSNNFELTLRAGNFQQVIPSLASGYVDISTFDEIVIKSVSAGKVEISIYNYVISEGFTSRGTAISNDGDIYFDDVKALYHFEGQVGTSVTPDQIETGGAGALKLTGNSVITNTVKKFGDTCFRMDYTPSSAGMNSVNSITLGKNYTVEFFVNVQSFHSTSTIFFRMNGIGTTDFNMSSPVAGKFVIGMNAGLNSSQLNMNEWYHIAFVFFADTVQLYVNGVFSGTVPYAGAGGTGVLSFNPTGINTNNIVVFFDEMRVTNRARYLVNFTPPSEAFKNF